MTEEEWAKAKVEGERIRHERERRMVAVLVASSVFQKALDYIASAQQGVHVDVCPACKGVGYMPGGWNPTCGQCAGTGKRQ